MDWKRENSFYNWDDIFYVRKNEHSVRIFCTFLSEKSQETPLVLLFFAIFYLSIYFLNLRTQILRSMLWVLLLCTNNKDCGSWFPRMRNYPVPESRFTISGSLLSSLGFSLWNISQVSGLESHQNSRISGLTFRICWIQ